MDAVGDWDEGALRVRRLRSRATPTRQVRCTVYRPDIGGLLPVYVADRYEGIEARTFAECSDEEVAHYIDANVAAVRELAARVRPEVALANHLVMGPVILARALAGEVPYAVKIHGSALEYTVKPQPERFLALAREGLARRPRDPRRLPSHRGEPVAGASERRRSSSANPPGPTGGRRRALRAPRTRGGRGRGRCAGRASARC